MRVTIIANSKDKAILPPRKDITIVSEAGAGMACFLFFPPATLFPSFLSFLSFLSFPFFYSSS